MKPLKSSKIETRSSVASAQAATLSKENRSVPQPKTPASPPPTPRPPATPAPSRMWWYVLLVIGVLLFVPTAYIAHKHTLAGWELHAFRLIDDWPNSLRIYFLIATIAPESLWIGVAAVGATFLLKMYRLTWQLAAAIIGGFAFAEVGKKLIGRARPAELISNIQLRAADSGNGYPSGHTMIITVIVLTIWPYLPRGWRWLVALLIPIVGLSRVYLGLHAPLDIVGGFAVGAIVVSCMRVLPTLVRNFFRLD